MPSLTFDPAALLKALGDATAVTKQLVIDNATADTEAQAAKAAADLAAAAETAVTGDVTAVQAALAQVTAASPQAPAPEPATT